MLLLWDQYNFSCLLCCILKAYAETPFPPRIWNIRSWFELHYLKRGNVAHNIIFITYSLSHLTHINITIELPSVIKFLFLIKGGSRKYVIDTVGCVLLWAILGKGGRLETNGFQFFFPFSKWIFFSGNYISACQAAIWILRDRNGKENQCLLRDWLLELSPCIECGWQC